MHTPEEQDQVVLSPLVNQLRELVEQSRRFQAEVDRLNVEIAQVQAKIAALFPPLEQEDTSPTQLRFFV